MDSDSAVQPVQAPKSTSRSERTWATDQVLVALSEEVLDVAALTTQLYLPSCGGVVTFLGTTRDRCDSQEVHDLSYEAYEGMAITKLKAIANAAVTDFSGVHKCIIVHRLGSVPVCGVSVFIGVSAEHRAPAFEACHMAIDRLKAEVPIWKKERYVPPPEGNGEPQTAPHCWKANREFPAPQQ